MKVFTHLLIVTVALGGTVAHAQAVPEGLTLHEAVAIALAADPWMSGSRHTQAALTDEAAAAATLPDPKMSLLAGNFPVDTFDINQEAMTQLAVGVSQAFPRGDTLALARKQKLQLAQQHPLLREDRRAKVTATVAQLWLDAYDAQESIRLIETDRVLFEHLLDAAQASYSAAAGRARQQDVIRAQLELTRLDDRLTALRQRRDAAQRRLSEWLGRSADHELASTLPIDSPNSPVSAPASRQERYEQIRHHPALLALDWRIDAGQTDVDLARQKYKPEWGLSAQYGYRDRDLMGRDRADLFSVGVTFDLPLFTADRQDRQVRAAIGHAEAIKTEKQLLIRQLTAQLETAAANLARLEQRRALYADRLLPQMAEQAEASLAASSVEASPR